MSWFICVLIIYLLIGTCNVSVCVLYPWLETSKKGISFNRHVYGINTQSSIVERVCAADLAAVGLDLIQLSRKRPKPLRVPR